MKALSTASFAHAAGVVFFRDPRPRVAVVIKLTLALSSGPGGAVLEVAGIQSPIIPAIDLIPRKTRAEVILMGDAFSAHPSTDIPVEIAVGSSVRIRSKATTVDGRPAHRAVITGLGPHPSQIVPVPPANEREAIFSEAWIDVPREGLQIAPPSQQGSELISFGTPVSLFNLTPGGGVVVTRLPVLSAYAFLVENRSPSAAHRVALRADTLLVDTAKGRFELSVRGELEIDRFGTCPDVVVGLGPRLPGGPDLEAALRDGAPISLARLRARAAHRPPAETLHNFDETIRREALPFAKKSERPAQPDPSTATREPSRLPPLFSSPWVGPWRVESLERTLVDRAVLGVVHETLSVKGSLTLLDRSRASVADRVIRFERTVEMRQRVTEASLVPVLDRGRTSEGVPWVVDASPRGRSVSEALLMGSRELKPEKALRLAVNTLEALACLHDAGLVHGSLSPDGIFVSGDSVELVPSLTLREPCDDDAPSAERDPDASFASPEVALGNWAEVDARADVWSVAALVVYLVSRKPVHRSGNRQKRLLSAMTLSAPPVSILAPDLAPRVAHVLDRALAFSRSDRPPDANALLALLAEAAPQITYVMGEDSTGDSVTDDGPPTIDPRATSPLLATADLVVAMSAPLSTASTVDHDDGFHDEETHGGASDDELATVPPPPPDAPSETSLGPKTTPPPAGPFGGPTGESTSKLFPSSEVTGTGLIVPELTAPRALPFENTGAPPPKPSSRGVVSSSETTQVGVRAAGASALPFPAPSPSNPGRSANRAATPWAEDTAPVPAPAKTAEAPAMMAPLRDVPSAIANPTTSDLPRPSTRRPVSSTGTRPPPRWTREEPIETTALADVDALAAIAIASSDTRSQAIEVAGLDDVSTALAFEHWADTIDREAAAQSHDALRRLLSALHERALRSP